MRGPNVSLTIDEARHRWLRLHAVGPIWLTLLFVSPRAPLSSPLMRRRWRPGSPLVRIAAAPVVLAAVLIPILMAENLITRKIGWAGGRLVGVAYISVAAASAALAAPTATWSVT